MRLINQIVILINNIIAKTYFKQLTKQKKKNKSIIETTKSI